MSLHFNDPLEDARLHGFLGKESYERIKTRPGRALFSVRTELILMLYAGVLALSTGLGIIIYKHIGDLGHILLMSVLVLISFGSFWWVYRDQHRSVAPERGLRQVLNDYVLLLGALTNVIFFEYVQYRFDVFGNWGLQFLFASACCFWAAYYFNHLGVLSVAITAFGAFMGLVISPMSRTMYEHFQTQHEVSMGLLLSICLIGGGWYSKAMQTRPHFQFTYYHFALHIAFVAGIAGLYVWDAWIAMVPVLAIVSVLAVGYASRDKSMLIFIINAVYSFIAFICFISKLLYTSHMDGEGAMYLIFFLMIVSGALVIYFIRMFRRKISHT
ncbi:MAG TPA: DUF2157 domain-containing protein [Bacteroidia bacterium]|jgi:hypothetical protein|nr:DUF2157 domain-containing protein [Bacteroidia bacterium]